MVEFNIENGENTHTEEFDDSGWPEAHPISGEGATVLFELKSRRDKIASELVKSFQVARWEEPEIYCEFSVIEPSALTKALQKREKQKNRPDDWIAWAYSDILSANCKAVYGVLPDDSEQRISLRENDPYGALTRVDYDLARALGLDADNSSASKTFRALFFSEGDLIDLANKVFRWSAVIGEEADEAF